MLRRRPRLFWIICLIGRVGASGSRNGEIFMFSIAIGLYNTSHLHWYITDTPLQIYSWTIIYNDIRILELARKGSEGSYICPQPTKQQAEGCDLPY